MRKELTVLKQVHFFRHSRQLRVVASLVLSTVLCLSFLVLRVAHWHHYTYVWLWWNLFLAWVPLGFAVVAYNLSWRHSRLSWLLVAVCSVIWLGFLPNAPYLVTDIIHLKRQPDVPLWFDLSLFVATAWTGSFLGLASLGLMQEIVRRLAGSAVSWLFAATALGLSGVGICLGRFLRWNSWDVFLAPTQIIGGILTGLRHPGEHSQTFIFSLIFAAVFSAMYIMVVSLMRLPQESQPG
jgi:uncharacterized membrane protein